mgnify:CR=1 FL=1|tara:strand:- start:389 stop:709 length:321 start_codon:yes stop_codon:yes gene_type:complete
MTDLTIPDFLLRPRAEKTTRRLRPKKTAWKVGGAKRLPKAWRGAKTAFVMAYPPVFPPHFPTGYRAVLYLPGRKGTVRVREVVASDRRASVAVLTEREFERSKREG